MELAQAFDGFNGELRNSLRDAAAREDRDAMAAGELEAMKQSAAKRMGDIEGVLKQAVDSGQVSHVRLPAFERGYRSRVGRDLAESQFAPALTQRLSEATRVDDRTDPEQIIADTYASVSKQIHPDDLYARAAFDDVAQLAIANFRQRAAEGYTVEYKRAAEEKIADEGSELLFQLASAPAGAETVDATKYDTKLTPQQEQTFQQWKQQYAPNDSGQDYDFRGAFVAGLKPDANGHWPDTFKKPNHPTFSNESQYAKDRPDLAGSWRGGVFVPPQTSDGLLQAVRMHMDEVRKELPKSEVNGFYVKNVIAPTIDRLVSDQKFSQAGHLLDQMERLDVTGNGGMLSQTSIAKAAFSDLRAKVDRESRQAEYESYANLKRAREVTMENGELDAAKALNDLRLGNSGKLIPSDRFTLIDEYRKANAGDPLKVQGFASAVHREFDNEDKWRTDERKLSDLEVSIKSLNKDDLATGRARLDALYAAGEIPPSARTRLAQQIDRLQSLYGAIDEQDFNRFKRDVYTYTQTGGRLSREDTVNLGDKDASGNSVSGDLWRALPETMKDEHEQRVVAFFGQALQDELRAIGDPNKIPAEKSGALDRATLKARAYAKTLLVELNQRRIADEAKVKVQQQAQKIRNASLTQLGVRPDLGTGFKIPGKEANSFKGLGQVPPYLGDGYRHPGPEADAVSVWIPEANFKQWLLPGAAGTERTVVMSELAKDIRENPDEGQAGKSRALYGYVKSKLGFTPEEVKSGITKDGIPFKPSAIDPTHISVFRNKAELEKHWQDGKPDDLFLQLGDMIDPSGKLSPDRFYLAQSAIFSARTHLYSNSR